MFVNFRTLPCQSTLTHQLFRGSLLSPRKLQVTLAPMALRRRMLWYLKGFVCLCCRCQSEAVADPARALSCGSCGEKMGWQYLPGLGCHDFACLHCGAHASDDETKNEKTWRGLRYFKFQIEIRLKSVFLFTRLLPAFHSLKMCEVTLFHRPADLFEASRQMTLIRLLANC